MKAVRLRTEYLHNPVGLGNTSPRLMWNCEGGITQTAYQIVTDKWDSGKIASSSMQAVYPLPLSDREAVGWKIRLWDETGKPGEWAESSFEMGISDWTAKWISGAYKPRRNTRYPVDCFKKRFRTGGKIVKARLYASARGVYDVAINGTRLEKFILAPGITDYRKRIQVQTYDVTALLEDENTVELRLGDGWYRGSTAAYGVVNVYGSQTSVIAQLEVTYEDGHVGTLCTDHTWAWSNDGPIRFADLKDGEVYDASMKPSFDRRAIEVKAPKAPLVASDNVYVTEHERFTPQLINGNIFDFGQNMAGYVEFTVRGKAGQKFKLICGEVIGEDGHVDLTGIQESRPAKGWGRTELGLVIKMLTGKIHGENDPTPRQEIVFTCSGGEDHYKTSFAVFGFRYAEVIGDIEVNPTDFTAIAVYSDMTETGSFTCSNALVNRLVENTRWSMKGNFLDIPTDCPTRERLGWTGDAQIFFDTGAYLMDTSAFFSKWLRDMEDAQYKSGHLPAVLPYEGVERMYQSTGASVGWADAVYLIPYRFWKRFGDRKILIQYWPMMKRFAEYLMANLGMRDKKEARQNPDNDYAYEKGVHLGEWLEPEEFRDTVYGAQARHPEECTAYLYLAMTTMAEIAEELGEREYAAKLKTYAAGAKKAYLRFAELDTDRQAKLVRPLALGILDGETKQKAQKRLKKAVEDYRYRVGTGFLSTPFLLPVLTEAGEAETAYKMLLNTEKPGWLAEIADGATTIWENWEGNLSQNHYSPGAVCQWLFDTVCGIRVDGENHFTIAPVPGTALSHAAASYLSPYGLVKSSWTRIGEITNYTITVPANCTATVKIGGKEETIKAGEYEYAQ